MTHIEYVVSMTDKKKSDAKRRREERKSEGALVCSSWGALRALFLRTPFPPGALCHSKVVSC